MTDEQDKSLPNYRLHVHKSIEEMDEETLDIIRAIPPHERIRLTVQLIKRGYGYTPKKDTEKPTKRLWFDWKGDVIIN